MEKNGKNTVNEATPPDKPAKIVALSTASFINLQLWGKYNKGGNIN